MVSPQNMLHQSLKFTNGIWVLAELKIQPGNPAAQVRRYLILYRSDFRRSKMLLESFRFEDEDEV